MFEGLISHLLRAELENTQGACQHLHSNNLTLEKRTSNSIRSEEEKKQNETKQNKKSRE